MYKEGFSGFADVRKRYCVRKLLAAREPSSEAARKAVDSIVEAAGKHARRGEREDSFLYTFEEDVFKISDSLMKLHNRGMNRECRELWGRLYSFVKSCGQSVYMPLTLFILYRYASEVLCTGEPGRAAELYRDLLRLTDKMIGTDNAYGVLLWDRIGKAAAASGKPKEAVKAYEEAVRIAKRSQGLYSPFTLAVQHRLASVQTGAPAQESRRTLYLRVRSLLGEEHPLTQQLHAEYTD